MNLTDVYEDVNLQTDESYDEDTYIQFFNDGISYINRRKHTYYPYIDKDSTEYIALRETWIRQIVINYMCHLVKTQDSSQFEYTDFLKKCQDAMDDFLQIKDPDEYASDAHDDDANGGGVEVYLGDNRNNIMNSRW